MSNLRALIVEDEESTVTFCKFALQRFNIDVEIAFNATEALDKIKQEAFDLAVIDWLLPDGSGIALYRKMREHSPDLIGILITGQNFPEITREALEAGFWAFLAKPFTVSEFQATIERATEYIRVTREKEKFRLMASLGELAQKVDQYLELEEILQGILHFSLQQSRADKVSIMLVEESVSPPRLKLVAAEGLSPDLLSIEIPVGNGIAGQVALTGLPLLINAQTVHQFSSHLLHYRGAGSALSIPLKFGNRVIGVLNLTRLTFEQPFSESDVKFYLLLANHSASIIERARLHRKVYESYLAALSSFCQYVENILPYRQGHSRRVGIYAKRLAEAVGMSKQEAEQMVISALIQDLGLIRIPIEILNKSESLSDSEWSLVRQHPIQSLSMVEPRVILTETIEVAVKHHHERFDGTGYPEKIKGSEIPFPARLLAVADTFDALCSERPHRPAYPFEKALEEMKRVAGSQLDPELTEAFLQIVVESDNELRKVGER